MSFVAQLATNGNRKHCFLAIYDPRSSIVKSVFDCRLSGVISIHALKTEKKVLESFKPLTALLAPIAIFSAPTMKGTPKMN